MDTNRFGYLLALLGIVLGLAYFVALLAALLFSGAFPPEGIYEKTISIVTFLSVPGMVLLWVMIHQAAPAEKKGFSLGALALIIIFATLTSINRYNSLTVVPQAVAAGVTDGLEWFQPYGWPSIMAAMEVQAWGVYLGLAMLISAPLFQTGRLEKTIFWVLVSSGALCLLSAVGQIVNLPALNMVGILAWGPGLIALFGLLAAWFRTRERQANMASAARTVETGA